VSAPAEMKLTYVGVILSLDIPMVQHSVGYSDSYL
jgi:hypothetical protein